MGEGIAADHSVVSLELCDVRMTAQQCDAPPKSMNGE
jgi:hypothetical protein